MLIRDTFHTDTIYKNPRMDIMDGRNLAWIVLLLGKCTAVLGATNLACTPAYPTPHSPVICECEQNSRNDIQWFQDGIFISSCSAKNDICSPTPSRYIFKTADTASVSYYNLTIASYDYTDCGLYSCEDFSTPPMIDYFSLSIFDFTASSSTPITEPSSNHSNGNISIKTGCFINKTEVMENIQWYTVVKDVPTAYRPGFSITEDSASCKQCGGEQASKLIIQFYHEEATGDDVEEVRFRITLFHNRNKYDVLNMTTNNYYYVKVSDGSNTTGCACDIKDALIVVAVAWTGAIIFTVIGSCIYRYCCGKLELLECVFSLATVPLILIIVVMLLYKKGRNKMILFMISSFLEVPFIGAVICICFLTEICGLPDLLWASFVYVIVCGLSSVLKCIVIEKSKRDRNVANRNSDSKQNEENVHVKTSPSKEHGQPGTRKPLPRIPSISSRLGNVKEHEHSLKVVYPTHNAPLPPISKQEKG